MQAPPQILSVHRQCAPQVALPAANAAPAAGPSSDRVCYSSRPSRPSSSGGAPRRRVALRAHGAWAAWAAGALGAQMAEALRSDVALTSPLPLRGWEDTVVVQARAGAPARRACGEGLLCACPAQTPPRTDAAGSGAGKGSKGAPEDERGLCKQDGSCTP